MPDPSLDLPAVTLLSVNVAEPQEIGTRRGHPVLSAIGKQPVSTPTLELTHLNLAGDRQADLRVHGGRDKAVYAYPSEHLPFWTAELGLDPLLGPGAFGENLTTAGWLEDAVRIGDVWAWGDALLQVSEPRFPCFKLAMTLGRPAVVRRMTANARCGWYLRVLRPGIVPVGGAAEVVSREPDALTVSQAFRDRL